MTGPPAPFCLGIAPIGTAWVQSAGSIWTALKVGTELGTIYKFGFERIWCKSFIFHGRGGGIRTPDPLLPKQMRYQTALRPDI